jgi:hypothetical protein
MAEAWLAGDGDLAHFGASAPHPAKHQKRNKQVAYHHDFLPLF